jgi:hypothetical protein
LRAQAPNSDVSANQDYASSLNEDQSHKVNSDQKRQDRKERAVREREEKIKAERGRVEADIDRSRQGINKEEGEREFRCVFAITFLVHLLVALITCLC